MSPICRGISAILRLGKPHNFNKRTKNDEKNCSHFLTGNAGTQEFPYPDNANQIFLGYATPIVAYPNASIVSVSVTGTVPVTAGTIYFLVLKAGPRGGRTCDGTFSPCVYDIWDSGPIFDPDSGLGVAYACFDDASWTWVSNGTAVPAFRITANTYSAQVQPPINADGTSIFNSRRGVVAIRFRLTYGGVATCDLPPATIAVTRTGGGVTGQVNGSVYTASADTGSNFRVNGCQYTYHLDSRALGVGIYRLDILIKGQVVGSATFESR